MYITNAIVLRSREVGENDFIVSFFTQEFGKMVVTVRGAKKLETKQGNVLHRFSIVKIMFVIGKRSLILRSALELTPFSPINRSLYGYGYLNSFLLLCDSLLYENEKDKQVWSLMSTVMEDVATTVDTHTDNQKLCSALWALEKQWLYSFIEIMGLKEYNEIERVRSMNDRRTIDLFFKHTLERAFNAPVSFFGLILKKNVYES